MAKVDYKNLLRRMNTFCQRSLHGAVGTCVSRSHYEVTIEHVFAEMLQEPNCDLYRVFRHFGVEPARIQRTNDRVLEELKTGNAGRPELPQTLIDLIQDAWLIGSVDIGLRQVRSGALLLSALENSARVSLANYTDDLDKIGVEELKSKFYAIVGGSCEDEGETAPVTAGELGAPMKPGAPAGQAHLDKYTTNETARAAAGEMDPVLGRDNEMRQMIDVLIRRRKNNPILVGEAGVGKTAVVEGLAQKIAAGEVPDKLKQVQLHTLDMGLLQAGAGVKGEFENRLKNVMREVRESAHPIVLFIDEAHTLIGAGGAAGGSDAANLLKPALARGELRTIAATTWSEYKKYFEKDAALERRFQLIKIEEPDVEVGQIMLRGIKTKFENHHKVHITDEAVGAAVRLSKKYISGRQLPDKAVDLLDTAMARVATVLTGQPTILEDLDRQIQHAELAIKAFKRDEAAGLDDHTEQMREQKQIRQQAMDRKAEVLAQWEKEAPLARRVTELREQLMLAITDAEDEPQETTDAAGDEAPKANEAELKKELAEALAELAVVTNDNPLISLHVDAEVIAGVVADWTGIPVGSMVKDEIEAIIHFEQQFGKRIVGQDHVLKILGNRLRASRAGIQSATQPMGVFLFVGPSGVGKTECGLGLADLIFGGEQAMCTINMSEFMEAHTVSLLKGSPPGYVGYGEGGVLTEAVRQRPYTVVLLDEVEKAHPDVMNLFYQVFDKGVLADGEGREINFKNTVIIMTTNLGSDEIIEMCSDGQCPSPDDLNKSIWPALRSRFKPALLARMTVVPFYPISAEAMRTIAEMKLRRIGDRLMDSHKMTFEFDANVPEHIAERCTEIESGARNIDHMFSKTLLPEIAQSILERMAEGKMPDMLRLGVSDKGEFTYEFC